MSMKGVICFAVRQIKTFQQEEMKVIQARTQNYLRLCPINDLNATLWHVLNVRDIEHDWRF